MTSSETSSLTCDETIGDGVEGACSHNIACLARFRSGVDGALVYCHSCTVVRHGCGGSYIERLPLTTSILYLIVGVTLGPLGVGLLIVNPIEQSRLLELAAEVAVLISLFVAGLKLRSALTDRRWSCHCNWPRLP